MVLLGCARKSTRKDGNIFRNIFFLMFLPITVVVIILRSKKLNSTGKLILVSMVAFLVLVAAVSSSNDNAASTVPQQNTAQLQRVVNDAAVPTPTASITERPFDVLRVRHMPVSMTTSSPEPTNHPAVQIRSLVFVDDKNPSILSKNQSYDLYLRFFPSDADISDINITLDNESAATISAVSTDSSATYPTVIVSIETKNAGVCHLSASAKNNTEISDAFTFQVKTQAIESVSSHLEFLPDYEIGDKVTLKLELKPANLSSDDLIISSACEDIVSVSNVSFQSEDTSTIVQFNMEAHAAGDTYLVLASPDDLIHLEYKVHVIPKDNSRIVWITPTGKRYHFSEKDAGKNAIQVTQNEAEERGYTPCKTCSD